MRILISRTDSIGDVILTLPLTGLIRKHIPDAKILFMGRSYTRDIIQCSSNVDEFVNWDEIVKAPADALKKLDLDFILHVFPRKEIARAAKKAGIKNRVGASGRLYHWYTCNRIVRFSRRRSNLHESQLNCKLLQPLGIDEIPYLNEMHAYAAFNQIPNLPDQFTALIDPNKFNVILHPKSKGSAVEWGLENFGRLIEILGPEQYNVFITGTSEEGKLIGDQIPLNGPNVRNMLGALSLSELIALIASADGLVAASTGPLHVAGILDKVAIGLFSPRKPIHPGRWSPLGEHAQALVFDENCSQCAKGEKCDCIQKIDPEKVKALLH